MRFTAKTQLAEPLCLSDRELGRTRRVEQVVGRNRGSGIGIALATVAVLVGASACGGGGEGKQADPPASAKTSAKPSPTKPKGPPMLLETITPQSGATVGVAMPVSVVFTNPVAPKARASVEKHMKVSASQPVK